MELEIFELIAKGGKGGLAEFLIFKSDLEVRNSEYLTPLQYAIRCANTEAVEILLVRGAQIHSAGIIDLLVSFITDDTEYRLVNAMPPPREIEATVKFPINILNLLINSGFNINEPGENGDTLLIEACLGSNLALVRKLIELGADPNIINHDGQYALITAEHDSDIYEYLYPVTNLALRSLT